MRTNIDALKYSSVIYNQYYYGNLGTALIISKNMFSQKSPFIKCFGVLSTYAPQGISLIFNQ